MNIKKPSKNRGCECKMRIGSKESPHAKARELAKKHKKDYGVYECPWCGKFHLTTKLDNKERYKPLIYQTHYYS
ncbi:MAG: hypothetical protein H7A51_13525 [Akkermansiaceae bacterium]|nr:hypothetical protein [Akkermansiaceae bacterium]